MVGAELRVVCCGTPFFERLLPSFCSSFSGVKFYSQHGEDARLLEFFAGQTDGVCVEVGGFDGETFSNTLAFEEAGWRAIVVEPMPHFAEKIRARRPEATLFACAAGATPGEAKLVIAHGVEALSTTTAQADHLERIHKMGGGWRK